MFERIVVLAKYWVAIVASAEPTETVLDGWVVKKNNWCLSQGCTCFILQETDTNIAIQCKFCHFVYYVFSF